MLTVTFEKDEEGRWLGQCEELGTAIQAKTFEEANEILREAITSHLSALEQEGERERFFKKNRIKVLPAHPRRVSRRITFDVQPTRSERYFR